MGMTNKEKAAAYRERMYKAGLKQVRVWIPRESDGKTLRIFTRLEKIIVKWRKERQSKLLKELVVFLRKKTKEESES